MITFFKKLKSFWKPAKRSQTESLNPIEEDHLKNICSQLKPAPKEGEIVNLQEALFYCFTLKKFSEKSEIN
jgi:hypothetical protein